jgi:hypothetical protein
VSARLAQILTSLYPTSWRDRYGEEFRAFLEARPFDVFVICDVVREAFVQRFRLLQNYAMTNFQRSITFTAYAYLAAIAAGVNLYWITDDTPLIDAMHLHSDLSTCWNIVAAGSLLALTGVLGIVILVGFSVLRFALTDRRSDILFRLCIPLCAGGAVLLWLLGGFIWNGNWIPLPWAITGDWAAPGNWPPIETRWLEGSISLVLMTAALVVSGIAVKQAIERSDLSRVRSDFAKPAVFVVAASIFLMALGVTGWGVLASQYAPTTFHARFGLMGTTMALSWAITCALFAASSVTAVVATRLSIARQA